MKGVPALSPLPRWGTTPGEGEFNLFSAPINNSAVHGSGPLRGSLVAELPLPVPLLALGYRPAAPEAIEVCLMACSGSKMNQDNF
jgi:hypothetical protein